jgi:hypothetical protein
LFLIKHKGEIAPLMSEGKPEEEAKKQAPIILKPKKCYSRNGKPVMKK